MERGQEIRTERLLLRRWREGDRAPFARMNADAEVTRYFPNTLSRDESDAMVDRIERHFEQHGFGLWAVEVVKGPAFIGFVGLAVVDFDVPFAPSVEIGWRLAREFWNAGYATEAASAVLHFGFECLGLEEIVAFTVPSNTRSRAVMERIGMKRDEGGDFENPRVPEGHALRHHVLYRIGAPSHARGDEEKEHTVKFVHL